MSLLATEPLPPSRTLGSVEKRMGKPVGLHLLSALVILTLALKEWVSLLDIEWRRTYPCLSLWG